MFTHSELLSELRYNQFTGQFVRRSTDKLTGHLSSKGQVVINVLNETIFADQLAWFYSHGAWPVGVIKHADGVQSHNQISNLRDSKVEAKYQPRNRYAR